MRRQSIFGQKKTALLDLDIQPPGQTAIKLAYKTCQSRSGRRQEVASIPKNSDIRLIGRGKRIAAATSATRLEKQVHHGANRDSRSYVNDLPAPFSRPVLMCGITGALSNRPVGLDRVLRMRDTLTHRGPDHGAYWTGNEGRIVLAHRRLAIVDLRPEANQPFLSHDSRYAVVFNGEIYNHRDLRRELIATGVCFRTQSDTEVLVEAFRAWGERTPDRLSGMFAFAIWDVENRNLFCSRDRAGEKPFYYCLLGGTFLFASELKALTEWPGFRKELDYQAVIDYLSLGFVTDPKAIWHGCRKLPPGHSMWVSLSEAGAKPNTPVAYWDMQFDPDHSVRNWHAEILGTLQHASTEMSVADVPLGVFLSGGVDSSSVAAALSRSGQRLKTFTIGFEEQAYDERPWARAVADLCVADHRESIVRAGDVGGILQNILWHYDEPFNDFSSLPTFCLCYASRKHVTVALSGDGGDELFAGYTKYKRLSLKEKLRRALPSWARNPFQRAAAVIPSSARFSRLLNLYTADSSALLASMLMTCFSTGELRTAARGALAQELKHYAAEDAIDSFLQRAPVREVGLVNAMRYLDLKITLASGILVKVDRASMAVSLEVRPVYLHRDVLRLAGRIPYTKLCDSRTSKKALKRALEPWLPKSILYRRKMGFGLPLKVWLPHGMADFVKTPNSFVDSIIDVARLPGSSEHGDPTLRAHNTLHLQNWLNAWTGEPRLITAV